MPHQVFGAFAPLLELADPGTSAPQVDPVEEDAARLAVGGEDALEVPLKRRHPTTRRLP